MVKDEEGILTGEEELVVDRLKKYFSGLYLGGNDGESCLEA